MVISRTVNNSPIQNIPMPSILRLTALATLASCIYAAALPQMHISETPDMMGEPEMSIPEKCLRKDLEEEPEMSIPEKCLRKEPEMRIPETPDMMGFPETGLPKRELTGEPEMSISEKKLIQEPEMSIPEKDLRTVPAQ